MTLLIHFPTRQDRLRAIDIFAESGETYHGVPTQCYVVSEAAAKLLETNGVRYEVVGDKKETVNVAGS
jgi:hypothetical protein